MVNVICKFYLKLNSTKTMDMGLKMLFLICLFVPLWGKLSGCINVFVYSVYYTLKHLYIHIYLHICISVSILTISYETYKSHYMTEEILHSIKRSRGQKLCQSILICLFDT